MLANQRDPETDYPLIISPGHLSILTYGLDYVLGRELASPYGIIDNFRTLGGLPGHAEAGIGETPYGTGPLGKGPSYALGVALGRKMQKQSGIVDVLVGDGEMQEGQPHEMLRLAPQLNIDNIVMHMDCNDVQLHRRPTDTMSSDFASLAHAAGWHVIEVENGNDPGQVRAAQTKATQLCGNGKPVFICYYTTMGNGVKVMEEGVNETGPKMKNFHGSPLSKADEERALRELPDLDDAVEAYEPTRRALKTAYDAAGRVEVDRTLPWNIDTLKSAGYSRTVTEKDGAARKDFGAVHILNLMKHDPRIVVLHADIAGSGGFGAVEKEFPDRVINCGIAEANMYSMAAGLRHAGFLPVTYTFAPFAVNEGRAALRLNDINLNHTRCGALHDLTHAGTSVGEDGTTHQELNYLSIPFDNSVVWSTADSNQAGAMAEEGMRLVAQGHTNVFTIFPRTDHPQLKKPDGSLLYGPDYEFDGKADLVRGCDDCTDRVTIITTGITTHEAVAAVDDLGEAASNVRVLNVASIRPLDSATILRAALETGTLVVVEDHNIEGGLASQVADLVGSFGLPVRVRRLGANGYQESAPANVVMHEAGFDRAGIKDVIDEELMEPRHETVPELIAAIGRIASALGDPNNRFALNAAPYISQLATDESYMHSLLDSWSERQRVERNLYDVQTRLRDALAKLFAPA